MCSLCSVDCAELVSGDGFEEHDRTLQRGKFWAYERAIWPKWYSIFDAARGSIELYELIDGKYYRVVENQRGLYAVASLGAAVGYGAAPTATNMRFGS